MNQIETQEKNWTVYMLSCCDNKKTYIGASNNPVKRLKSHNGILTGGAKTTRTSRPWKHVFIIENLDKISALQLEWRLKRWNSPINGKIINCPGLHNRTVNLFNVLNLEKWTSKSVPSNSMNLHIKFFSRNDTIDGYINSLPKNITYEFIKN